mgnify:CR=1 FL=1|jgi:hypothetical protein
MSLKKQNIHWELKIALMLKRVQLKEFAQSLVRPNGIKGVSHTAVIRVAQNHENTPWLRDAIKDLINDSRKKYPDVWKEVMQS